MTSIDAITIEADDPAAAAEFYAAALGPGVPVRVRAADEPASGFRAFTLSLLVSQPADADAVIAAALAAGATALKPAAKSMWGYGGVVQAPDGTIWKVATSKKKSTGPATRDVEQVVLLLGVEDIGASKRFYADRGFEVAKSFPRVYVELEAEPGAVKLALYTRRGLAKDAGVAPEGTGSHRLVIAGGDAPFTDPDGFAWEPASTSPPARAEAAMARS